MYHFILLHILPRASRLTSRRTVRRPFLLLVRAPIRDTQIPASSAFASKRGEVCRTLCAHHFSPFSFLRFRLASSKNHLLPVSAPICIAQITANFAFSIVCGQVLLTLIANFVPFFHVAVSTDRRHHCCVAMVCASIPGAIHWNAPLHVLPTLPLKTQVLHLLLR